MNGYSTLALWTVILGLGAGTYALRFSFLGLFGRRRFPGWLLRHLRYAPTAVIPALVAPLVLWPAATGGLPEPARLSAAVAALLAGALLRNTFAAIVAGALVLTLGLWLT